MSTLSYVAALIGSGYTEKAARAYQQVTGSSSETARLAVGEFAESGLWPDDIEDNSPTDQAFEALDTDPDVPPAVATETVLRPSVPPAPWGSFRLAARQHGEKKPFTLHLRNRSLELADWNGEGSLWLVPATQIRAISFYPPPTEAELAIRIEHQVVRIVDGTDTVQHAFEELRRWLEVM